MIRHRGFLVLALVAMLAVALLPASNLEAQGSKGTIKIATQSPLSGGQAALGEGINGDQSPQMDGDVVSLPDVQWQGRPVQAVAQQVASQE